MKGGQGLMGDLLDRDGSHVLVAPGLQESLRVRAIGLVARDIAPNDRGRNQNDAVPDSSESASPVVCRAAGLEQKQGPLGLSNPELELGARKPVAAGHAPRRGRHGHLEDGLGKIDGNERRIHGGLLLWVLNSLFSAIVAL